MLRSPKTSYEEQQLVKKTEVVGDHLTLTSLRFSSSSSKGGEESVSERIEAESAFKDHTALIVGRYGRKSGK